MRKNSAAAAAGNAPDPIRYAVARSALGHVLVAATRRGIRALFLGDAPGLLVSELRRRFPRSNLVADARALEPYTDQVLRCIENPGAACGLPLDLAGTPWQRRVWEALREIPPGRTATYAEIAARVGNPRAVRAVAAACAANPVAVLIPCHRVVRSDGALGGYRWGLARKKELLNRERRAAEAAGRP